MRQSKLFTKARREAPADETAKNAELLIRAGYVHKEMAGVYDYLPLGLRVIEKIKSVVREEMNAVGGQEILMSALQDKTLWERTDRWDDEKVDNWFKTSLAAGGQTGLAITHEEPLTRIMGGHIASYRDLPAMVYQFQNKFRNELRAKSGLMRGREFLMKDLYSFAADASQHEAQYLAVREAYHRVFRRLGIGDRTYVTYASGGVFSDFSEEFQTLSEAGEDTVYVDEAKGLAINKEVLNDAALAKLNLSRDRLVEKRAIESGNIFHLGTRFSEALGLTYKDSEGREQPVIMGSYGIGITRLVGILAEVFSDERGLVWPASVAPFAVHLVSLGKPGDEITKTADELYDALTKAGIEVFYDDRAMSAGAKFAESDLLGIPARIVVGKDAATSGAFEVIARATGTVEKLPRTELVKRYA